MLVMGIDLGTSGARAMIVDEAGRVVSTARRSVAAPLPHPAGWLEQDPRDWWRAVRAAVKRAVGGLEATGHRPADIAAVCATSTSGTILLLDHAGQSLRPAILYNDPRSSSEGKEADAAGRGLWSRLGYRMNASFGLPKILWLQHHEPHHWQATRYVVHAADYLSGQLTGRPGVSDVSNALKTGYDLLELRWPESIFRSLGLDMERFPMVLNPGELVGRVSAQAARETGLAPGTAVVAGMTDGCTSQIATGAVAPGDWSTTIGSTLVVKGVTRQLLVDPTGVVYSHRHPEGLWMPGGAGNTGGAVLASRFGRRRLERLQRLAKVPTDLLVYPLPAKGERFPFACPTAEAFTIGEPTGEGELYAAHLEGIAYVEKLAYDVLQRMGADTSGPVAAAGGGASNQLWLQIRADVLGRPILLPETPDAAFGAAILAASYLEGQGLVKAARARVRIAARFEPRPEMVRHYAERYGAFIEALSDRGYITKPAAAAESLSGVK